MHSRKYEKARVFTPKYQKIDYFYKFYNLVNKKYHHFRKLFQDIFEIARGKFFILEKLRKKILSFTKMPINFI